MMHKSIDAEGKEFLSLLVLTTHTVKTSLFDDGSTRSLVPRDPTNFVEKDCRILAVDRVEYNGLYAASSSKQSESFVSRIHTFEGFLKAQDSGSFFKYSIMKWESFPIS